MVWVVCHRIYIGYCEEWNMVCEDTCITKNKPKLRIKHVLKFLPQNRAQGHATAFGSTGYFAGWGAASQRHGLLGSVKTEYPNDGSGLPSKSDHIWSCRPPPFKKDNGIFGLTTGD